MSSLLAANRKQYFLLFVNQVSYHAPVPPSPKRPADLRLYRNSKLYRSLTRTLRVYNRLLLTRLQARGFDDFAPAFPSLMSNLDMEGTRIGVLANRAGVTRQAAGQLLREIERCGYVERRDSAHRTAARRWCTSRREGAGCLATVLELVEEIEAEFASGAAARRVRAGPAGL